MRRGLWVGVMALALACGACAGGRARPAVSTPDAGVESAASTPVRGVSSRAAATQTAQAAVPPTPTAAPMASLTLPIRAAFYYGWYPEHWSSAGHRYTSTLGEYSSSSTSVIDKHINEMLYGNIEAGIYSWWGVGSATDGRFSAYLKEAARMGFHWAIYYELDNNGQAAPESVRSDISYLATNYFNQPGYLRVGGEPVVFVYTPGGTCDSEAKWTTMRSTFNLYVSLDDYPQWWTCNPVDSWHGYHSDEPSYPVYYANTMYSVSASAGFWSAAEPTPRLSRDYSAWTTTASYLSMYSPGWQLLYFNEFGEGTNIEPSTARCSVTGCLDYLQPLHDHPPSQGG